MREIILSALFLVSFGGIAQEKDKSTPELNCYNKWAAKFEERGADAVFDGTYDDVIITLRQGAKATCSNGKVEIKEGKIVKFYYLLSDGSHELVQKNWKNKSNENVTVYDGISKTMITVYGELINVLFPAKMKAKKAKHMVAPDPVDD